MKLAALLALAAALAFAAPPSYRITHTYTLGGDGGWDYVIPDIPHHRIFIARETRLMVVDSNTGKLIGEVSPIDGAHGTAVTPFGHGFATSSENRSVVMFDLKTLKVLSLIPAADDADAIVFDAPSARLLRRWPTAPCSHPVSMAIDTAHHRLFSGCRSGLLAVSDYQSGKIVATVPIGQGVDGAAYDPGLANVFASNADGTLTVIHQDSPDSYHVAQTLATPLRSRNMGIDPATHRLFLVSAKFGPAAAHRRPPVLPGSFSLLVVEPAAP